jgi:hypothetical protein
MTQWYRVLPRKTYNREDRGLVPYGLYTNKRVRKASSLM